VCGPPRGQLRRGDCLTNWRGAVDLVLTDVAMPGGLGSELAAEIRSSRRWVRVLYMSRYSREELLDRGIERERPS
jgi:two-component system cell cycle sensor histidine kinase/response regulator CckA